jgi:superfamily II DNA helicase RecQ
MNQQQILDAYSQVQKKFKCFHYDLKKEQLTTLQHILANKNVLTNLPTGYGKTATFVLPPLLLNEAS